MGNVYLWYAEYRVMFCYFHVAKLNKNKFCLSQSRLGGNTENSSCEGAHIMQFDEPKSVGTYACICTRQPSEVSLRYEKL